MSDPAPTPVAPEPAPVVPAPAPKAPAPKAKPHYRGGRRVSNSYRLKYPYVNFYNNGLVNVNDILDGEVSLGDKNTRKLEINVDEQIRLRVGDEVFQGDNNGGKLYFCAGNSKYSIDVNYESESSESESDEEEC